MNIGILTIGDELLDGCQANTNAPFLSERLSATGRAVTRIVSVGDRTEEIVEAMRFCAAGCRAVVVSGGLGPTSDDLTRFAAAEFWGVALDEDPEEVERIAEVLQQRGRAWVDSNKVQALLPRGCRWMKNRMGTASGFAGEFGGVLWFFLPGVPAELTELLEQEVLPHLPGNDSIWLERRLRYWNYGESALSESLRNWVWGDEYRFGSLPTAEGLLLKIDRRLSLPATAEERRRAEEDLDRTVKDFRAAIDAEPFLYSARGWLVEEEVAAVLHAKEITLSVAESCTGGGVGRRLTRIPGISSRFVGGAITYSNAMKIELLEVDPELLERCGAVSGEVAEAMALGVARRTGTDCGIAVSGVAGPGGGTIEKPVGTVWIAVSVRGEVVSEMFRLSTLEGREGVRLRSEVAALVLFLKTARTAL